MLYSCTNMATVGDKALIQTKIIDVSILYNSLKAAAHATVTSPDGHSLVGHKKRFHYFGWTDQTTTEYHK